MGDAPVCRCGWRRLLIGNRSGVSGCWLMKWHVEGSGSWVQVPDGALVAFGSVQEGFMAAGGVGGRGGAA